MQIKAEEDVGAVDVKRPQEALMHFRRDEAGAAGAPSPSAAPFFRQAFAREGRSAQHNGPYL